MVFQYKCKQCSKLFKKNRYFEPPHCPTCGSNEFYIQKPSKEVGVVLLIIGASTLLFLITNSVSIVHADRDTGRMVISLLTLLLIPLFVFGYVLIAKAPRE